MHNNMGKLKNGVKVVNFEQRFLTGFLPKKYKPCILSHCRRRNKSKYDDDEWGFEGKGWGVWILFLSEFAWNPFPVPDQLVNMKVDSDDQDWSAVLDDNLMIICPDNNSLLLLCNAVLDNT